MHEKNKYKSIVHLCTYTNNAHHLRHKAYILYGCK